MLRPTVESDRAYTERRKKNPKSKQAKLEGVRFFPTHAPKQTSASIMQSTSSSSKSSRVSRVVTYLNATSPCHENGLTNESIPRFSPS